MSEIDPFQGLTSFPAETSSDPESLQKSGLGRDAFLQIFLTQLAHQDPLAPQDASELSSQLAVFSQVEQQTLMAEQLRGVNTRLDKLIASFGGTATSALDPVSLIGKQVEVATSDLVADASRDSTDVLRFDIADAGVQSLLIAGESGDGDILGLASLGVPNGAAELARGRYALSLRAGALQLQLPDGSVLSGEALPLTPFVRDAASGELRAVPPGSPGAPELTPVQAGAVQELSVATRNRAGTYRPVTTHVTGSVSSVRVVDGAKVITVNGADLDPAKVIRIQ
jgi:hypothetical protein